MPFAPFRHLNVLKLILLQIYLLNFSSHYSTEMLENILSNPKHSCTLYKVM